MNRQPTPAPPGSSPGTPAHQPRRHKRLRAILLGLAAWAIAAYIIIPAVWKGYFRHHASLASAPRLTHTADGHPGDPLNIALVGPEASVIRAMTAAGWYPADPITLQTSLRIAVDSVFRRPDDQAPVSSLYLFGRKQDLAFEQPVGNSPRQRHHVRFWQSDTPWNGEILWLGSATFDERVGLSFTTAQITHHIGPDVDAERDRIVNELRQAGWLQSLTWKDDFQAREGRNGGGDMWRTDGRLAIATLAPPSAAPPGATNGSPR